MTVNRNCVAPGELLKDTHFGYTLSILGGKHKMIIIYLIAQNDNNIRFNELHREMGGVSYRALSMALKELAASGIVERREYPQVPPKVEYSLTGKGLSLLPIMDAMCLWGREHS
ncbi:winged helix-turn-helix transcriptional regulator [Cloacibacillus porcorum]|uniref:winged helix-turn-helix transcriptional regulator n=1 Tax=Cloacibacillus porcorum TaxID=1197717 RepID=UPI003F0C2E22